MGDKICIDCQKWVCFTAEPDYSDVTPGLDFRMYCKQGRWELDPYRDAEERIGEYFHMADGCKDFKQRVPKPKPKPIIRRRRRV